MPHNTDRNYSLMIFFPKWKEKLHLNKCTTISIYIMAHIFEVIEKEYQTITDRHNRTCLNATILIALDELEKDIKIKKEIFELYIRIPFKNLMNSGRFCNFNIRGFDKLYNEYSASIPTIIIYLNLIIDTKVSYEVCETFGMKKIWMLVKILPVYMVWISNILTETEKEDIKIFNSYTTRFGVEFNYGALDPRIKFGNCNIPRTQQACKNYKKYYLTILNGLRNNRDESLISNMISFMVERYIRYISKLGHIMTG